MAFRKVIFRSALTLCISIFTVDAGFAQASQPADQPPPVRRLAALVLSQGYYEGILDQTALILADAVDLGALLKRPVGPPERDKFQSIVRDAFTEVFPVTVFIDAFVPLYEKFLNPDEVLALLDFYRTPLGQRVLFVQGRLMIDGGRVADEQFKVREVQLQQILQQKLADAFPQK